MRKALKGFIIAGIALCVAGVLTFVIGMSIIGWDFFKLDTAKYEAKQFESSEQIVAVKLDIDSFPITVKSGDVVTLDYYEASDSKVSVEVSDGVLKIRERRSRNPFNGMFNLGRINHRYTLTVSSEIDIDIISTSSSVRFDGLDLPSLAVSGANTDLELVDCTINEFTVSSTNLDLEMRNCAIDILDLKSGANADIEIASCRGQSVSLSYTNLTFDIESSQYDEMNVLGVNIDVVSDELNVNSLLIDGVNVDASLIDITVDTLDLSGTNLDAHIMVNGERGDYTILSDGRGLPHSSVGATDKKITLSGVNNDVDLVFSL